MHYATYLESPEWKHRRDYMLRRADHRCSLCDTSTNSLDVHHRTYERLGREYDADLIVLCRPCHDRHHKKPKVKPLVDAITSMSTRLEELLRRLVDDSITKKEQRELQLLQAAARDLIQVIDTHDLRCKEFAA